MNFPNQIVNKIYIKRETNFRVRVERHFVSNQEIDWSVSRKYEYNVDPPKINKNSNNSNNANKNKKRN